jgi:hypothetical protein
MESINILEGRVRLVAFKIDMKSRFIFLEMANVAILKKVLALTPN